MKLPVCITRYFALLFSLFLSTGLFAQRNAEAAWKTKPAKNAAVINFGDVSGGVSANYERRIESTNDNMSWKVRLGYGTGGRRTTEGVYDANDGWIIGGGFLLGKKRWQWQNEAAWMWHSFRGDGDLALTSGIRRQVARANMTYRADMLYLPYGGYANNFGIVIGFGVGF